MTNTQIMLTIMTVAITSVALFGSYKFASAHSTSVHSITHSWQGGMMYQLHAITEQDWDNPDKIAQYRDMCVQRSFDRVEAALGHIESELELSDGQSGSWSQFVNTVHTEKTTLEFVCDKMLIRENMVNLPARLELFTTIVATGQESLQRLSPAIIDFYATLNEQQKATVEDLLAKFHSRHSMMWNH